MQHEGARLRMAHFSDLHYSPGHLAEAERCFGFAVEDAIAAECVVGVVSGDSTDHRLDAHTPALGALACRIHQLSASMPLLMLQGTFSHEPAGTLDLFRLIGARYPVYVADRIHQVALRAGVFIPSEGPLFTRLELDRLVAGGLPDVVFTCVPTVNKAVLASVAGVAAAATALGDHLSTFLVAAGAVNQQLRGFGVRTVGVSHGTVNGCLTEHGVPMAGFDHEFTIGALFAAQCDAFMLGHIHRCQQWEREGRVVAYPGSIGRFHYGEEGDKSYLQWSVAPGNAVATPVVTPARETVCIDFNGPPDMDQLALAAATADDKFFRIRWTIDEEHRQLVDRDAICALFGAAAELKLEGRVLPAVRSRAEGISRAATLAEKVERWGELAAVDTSRLVEYLPVLESLDAQAIVDLELAELADAVVPAGSVLPPPAVPAVTPPAPAPATAPVLDWLTDDLFAGEPA